MTLKSFYEKIALGVEEIYFQHGIFCSKHAHKIISFTCCIILLMSIGIFYSPLVRGNALIEWRSSPFSSNSRSPNWYDGKPLAIVQHIILQDKHETAFDIKVNDSPRLPEVDECFVLSPTLIWNNDLVEFLSDPDVSLTLSNQFKKVKDPLYPGNALHDHVSHSPASLFNHFQHLPLQSASQHNIFLASLFGLNWPISPPPVVMTIFLKPDLSTEIIARFRSEVITLLSRNFTTRSLNEEDFNLDYAMVDDIRMGSSECLHIYFSDRINAVELIPLAILYTLVFIYIVISVRKITLVKSKIGLACTAVATIVFSFIMSIGFCAFFNLLPTLSGGDIFPYIFTLIGLENVLTITRSVTITSGDKDTSLRIAKGLSKEGFRITKNMLGLAGVFVVGMITPVPAAFHEFCVVAFVSVIGDFFLQLFFFVPVLSLDIRRLELTDLKSGPYPAPSIPVNGKLLDWTDRPRKTRIFRYRATHKIVMLSVCMYVMYVLYHSLFGVEEDLEDHVTRSAGHVTRTRTNPILQMMQKFLDIHSPEGRLRSAYEDIFPHYFFTVSVDQSWRRVARDTWPQLLAHYQVSLTARYFNVYKPISIGDNTQPINYHTQVSQWLQMPFTLHLISTLIGLVTFLPVSVLLYLIVMLFQKLTAHSTSAIRSNANQESKNTIEIPFSFTEHQEDIILISCNDKEVLSSSADCANILWCVASGNVKLKITSDEVPWGSLVFSDRIVLGHKDGRLNIITRATSTVSTVHCNSTGVVFLDNLDHNSILVYHEDGILETIALDSHDLWDPSPTLMHRTKLHPGSKLHLCKTTLSLLVTGNSLNIRVICARTHSVLHVLQFPHVLKYIYFHRDTICAITDTSNIFITSLVAKTLENISYTDCNIVRILCNEDWIVGTRPDGKLVLWEKYTDYQPTTLHVTAIDTAILHDIYLLVLTRDTLHVWHLVESTYTDEIRLACYVTPSSNNRLRVEGDTALIISGERAVPLVLSRSSL